MQSLSPVLLYKVNAHLDQAPKDRHMAACMNVSLVRVDVRIVW